jgi:predicted DNA-binding transcriptional regulator YafY
MPGNKNSGKNRDSIRRTVRIVQMFYSRKTVTCKQVQNRLDVSRHTANRLISEISRVLPIIEVEVLPKAGSPIVYRLMK